MSNHEEQEFIEYCDRLTWRYAAQYLYALIAFPMSIVFPTPDYQEDF